MKKLGSCLRKFLHFAGYRQFLGFEHYEWYSTCPSPRLENSSSGLRFSFYEQLFRLRCNTDVFSSRYGPLLLCHTDLRVLGVLLCLE